MRVRHLLIAAAVGVWLVDGSAAQAQRPGKSVMVPHRPMMMPAAVAPPAAVQARAALIRRSMPRRDFLEGLRERAILRERYYQPGYNPYLPYVNPYAASANVYTPPGAMYRYPMSSYAGSGYGVYPSTGYGGGTSPSNAGNSSYTPGNYTPSAPPSTSAVEEVELHDSYFKPSLVIVPVGTTVKWVNYGRHFHTVTSNSGQWDSGALSPQGGSYSITFSQPGIYYYFCTMHPREMRGMIQVTGSPSGSDGQHRGDGSQQPSSGGGY